MKSPATLKVVKADKSEKTDECCCHSHMHGRKPIFVGLFLVIIGSALAAGYNVGQVIALAGILLIIKSAAMEFLMGDGQK